MRVWRRLRAAELLGRVLRRPATALLVGVLAAAVGWAVPWAASTYSLRAAVRQELVAGGASPEVMAFYGARSFRPIWVEAKGIWPFWSQVRLRPAVRERAAMAFAAAAEPHAPRPLRQRVLRGLSGAALGGSQYAAQLEVALTSLLVAHARALSEARQRELAFVDPDLPGPIPTEEFLHWASFEPSSVVDVRKVNPVYDALAEGLAAYRRDWSSLPQIRMPAGPALRQGDGGPRVSVLRARLGLSAGHVFDAPLTAAVRRFQAVHGLPVTGAADARTVFALNLGAPHFEELIRLNLERARGLPPLVTDRFILVNPAARRLWLYEGERVVDTMKVIVGSPRRPTPNMVGVIRYLVYNPSWEIPPDLARDEIAPAILRHGPHYLEERKIEVLSDWSEDAQPVTPAALNWPAVASGAAEARLRQAPGPANQLGRLKFMMPNELGIYLHDTPARAAFQSEARQISAGCVRVERAGDLAAWILIDAPWNPAFLGVDQEVDQFSPVTVYIIYLTAAPAPDGVTFFPDVYGRDPPSFHQRMVASPGLEGRAVR